MMQAWCYNLAKQTAQRLASSCSAASHQVAAHSKHPSHQACKSVLPQSGLTASLFNQVKAEHSWHSKVASQLVRPSQQSAALASSPKQLPKNHLSSALQFRCSPRLVVSTGQRVQQFVSLLSPKAGLAQRSVPVQQLVCSSLRVSGRAADLSCLKGTLYTRCIYAGLSTVNTNAAHAAHTWPICWDHLAHFEADAQCCLYES